MFESAQIGHAIDKEAYEAAVPALREFFEDCRRVGVASRGLPRELVVILAFRGEFHE